MTSPPAMDGGGRKSEVLIPTMLILNRSQRYEEVPVSPTVAPEAKKCGFDTHGGRLFRDLTNWAWSAKIESTVRQEATGFSMFIVALSPQG
jgi:hypothetical protein